MFFLRAIYPFQCGDCIGMRLVLTLVVRTRMLGLPDGFPDENDERHIPNQTPPSSHSQLESPGSGNSPEDGGFLYSFNFPHDYDFNFPSLISGTQPFEMGHQFTHPGTSGAYVNHAAGSRAAGTYELLSLPSVGRVT